ncbi:hypothetical protein [Roseivirga sp. E12]|uniref:hypothetical protein n=1 Tax=Roseivirga sp. E12 TaxID=2819237 RepID=UPI001ABD0B3B|nr:hypothetical protein [Roseivirga sp. E12]MBO3700122.1 hypothetical protein [Roseivirga sp. E12]
MVRKFITKLDSYALMIIALLAVVVSIWQVNHQRHHDRISMMPYVSWEVEPIGDTISVKIWNKGAGPALITNYSFSVNDSTFGAWQKAFAFADPTIKSLGGTTFGSYTLAANEKLTLVSYVQGLRRDGNLRIDIQFESVYGDKKEDYLISSL